MSVLAPRWRRAEWLAEWDAEWMSHGGRRPSRREVLVGALAHLAWLWRHEWGVDMFGSDIRYAVRTLRRSPGFAAAVISTLAIGIGATAAMYAVTDAVLVRSFPFPSAHELVVVWPRVSVSPSTIAEGRLDGGTSGTFASIGAYSGWGFLLTGGERAESLRGARVTPSLLNLLGVTTVHGRLLAEADTRAGVHVAVISERLWRRRFGADPALVGKTIPLNGVAHEIVGILPARFEFPDRRSDIWLPITIDPAAPDYRANFAVRVARLAPGVSVEQAEERLRVVAIRLQQENPKAFGGPLIERSRVLSLRDYFVRDVKTPLVLLLAGVAVLLLIACANVANLMLTRAAGRRGEMALRSALGADRGRLLRQLLVESLVLATASGVFGVCIAYGLIEAIRPAAPADMPNLQAATIDVRTLVITALVAIGAALLCGVVPGLRGGGASVRMLGSRSEDPASRAGGWRTVFAFVQVALAMALVTSAVLLGRSFLNLTRVDLGFTPDPVLTLRSSSPAFVYHDDASVRALYGEILERLDSLPGVESVGAIQLLPLTAGNWNPDVIIDGLSAGDQYPGDVNWRSVTPDYFETMGIARKSGRVIEAQDTEGSVPVAVVNETFARLVFRGSDPLGRRIRTGFEPQGVWATVVGVVADVHQHALAEAPKPEMYRPFAQHPVGTMQLMVKASGNPVHLAASVRNAVEQVDRDVALSDIEPMTAVVDRAIGGTRLPLLLATSLSAIALAIGLVGVAAVLSFDVAVRRPEIGIRMALGESPASIRRSILLRAAKLGAAALLAGALSSLAAAKALGSLLYGVNPADPITMAAVVSTCFTTVLLAAFAPAYRASSVDPLQTLRGN